MMRSAQRIRVSGLVQGVGFRPFVWRLARELALDGFVRNDPAGVEIAAEGERGKLETLLVRLRHEAPPLARVDEIRVDPMHPAGHRGFVIADSTGGDIATAIGHDTATCPDCLAEMFDPAGRRWRHAFITCTHCGPRYTVSSGIPYDRCRTSMAGFALCADCGREYADPADRRFHAETTCCPACGPTLRFCHQDGVAVTGDPVASALAALRAGDIVAIKGLGGFHLACDARNPDAVARLRQRKAREEKPFALLAVNTDSLSPWVVADQAARTLFQSPERPIVLMRKKPAADAQLSGVAPGVAWLGAMAPYTPLQWLLFHEAAGRPAGTAWLDAPQELLLVMTSANPAGDPLVIDNGEALERLAGIADAWLMHDRDILVRCDDSVVRPDADGARTTFIRRARGYAPRRIRLPRSGPSVLAVGGDLKNTICLTRGDEAYVSPHVGDLDQVSACRYLDDTIAHFLSILDGRPQRIACDLHPDFQSTRRAAAWAERLGIPLVFVQHHHAHLAAVAAEQGHDAPFIGLALDGVGYGRDGEAWGGELLRVTGPRFHRLGHLRPLRLPGGDRAAREPWRMAAAALHGLGRGDDITRRFAGRPGAEAMASLLDRQVRSPATSSLGRWFDAAAGLLGVRTTMNFEGQAAMELEGLAESHGDADVWADAWRIDDGCLDLFPLAARLADWVGDPAEAAARFHASLAVALATWIADAARQKGETTLALGGGCFLNRVLTDRIERELSADGFKVLRAASIPPNDGGISMGQAWVALQSEEE